MTQEPQEGQRLFLGNGQSVIVDRIFMDGGEPPMNSMVGNQVIRISEGRRPRPTIMQRGDDFFYQDMKPVTKEEDVDQVDPKYRALALASVRRAVGGQVKPLTARQKPGPKPKGKPAAPARIDSEEPLAQHSGGVVIR